MPSICNLTQDIASVEFMRFTGVNKERLKLLSKLTAAEEERNLGGSSKQFEDCIKIQTHPKQNNEDSPKMSPHSLRANNSDAYLAYLDSTLINS